MAAVYPANVRAFNTKIDLVDTVFALHINDLQDEVMAMQNVLGTNPQGTATGPATVGKRITDLEGNRSLTSHTHPSDLNAATHDIEARHTFGAAYGNPVLPAAIVVGAAGTPGTGDNPAKEDHQHPVPSALSLAASVIPAGTIVMYGGNSAPSGWVFCDGKNDYPRTGGTYDALFAVLGTSYGNASGTTFGVPDLRNRFPMGRATTGATIVSGGNRDATLVSHSHTVNSPSHGGGTGWQSADHSHGGTTDWMTENWNHNHDTYHDHYAKCADNNASGDVQGWPSWNNHAQFRTSDRGTVGGVWGLIGGNPMTSGGRDTNHRHNFGTGGVSANHWHSVGAESPGTNAQGSSATDANLPPYQTVNFIIKL